MTFGTSRTQFPAIRTDDLIDCLFPEKDSPYTKCFNLVRHHMMGHRLRDSFEKWGIHSPNILKERFSEPEIININSILERYLLLHYGSANLQDDLKLLEVSSIVEILNPTNSVFSSFNKLFVRPSGVGLEYGQMLNVLEAYVKIRLAPEKIIKLFDQSFVFDHSDLLGVLHGPLGLLSLEDRCRLAFFITMAHNFIDHYDTKRSITAQAGSWGNTLSCAMTRALKKIQAVLAKVKESTEPSELHVEPPAQFRIVKPDIAALPNFVPHAANSCFMASTLVPLAFVCNPEVQAALKKFEFMEDTPARVAFRSLYSLIKTEQISEISITQINALRTALQQAYDYRFFKPDIAAQEDAGDFLMCLFEDLLQPETNGHFYEKHTFQKRESSVLVEPERYNYDAALATKYRKLQQSMCDISIEEGATFCQLATGRRTINDMDLHAYLGESQSGPFQEVWAHHQEQFLVESADKAPNFFCARLRRFSQNPQTSARTKHQTPINPTRALQFQIKDKEESDERVGYDLHAITLHSGLTVDGGHYYCYLLHEGKIYKYNDLTGVEVMTNQAEVWQDVLHNGYIFYYSISNTWRK